MSDVPYLRTFTPELAPAQLRLVAALSGTSPPPAEGFDYCELGSGLGDTLATLAAANPGSRFSGIDIDAAHVEMASALARRGGLTGVRFFRADIEALRPADLPDLDYVVAHGVLSWVPPATRAALIALAAAKLRPGGLLHVSYNTLPGWAALEPLRRLLRDASGEGDALERARRALDFAKRLRDAGAGYFAHNPNAAAMLDTMEKVGLPYVAHEYLGPSWHPMYFPDVARLAAGHGLVYTGQLPLYLNDRDLTFDPSLLALLGGATDRVTFEGLKDFAVNELFRRDVYVKAGGPASPTAASEYMDTTPFGTLVPASEIRRELRLPHGTLPYSDAVFDALIPLLAASPKTGAELAAHPALSVFASDLVRESLHDLLLGGQILPMRLPAASAAAPGPPAATDRRFQLSLEYNRMILGQPLTSRHPIVLAVPAAGTGLVLSVVEAVCLRAVTEAPASARPAWLRDLASRRPLDLRVSGARVGDPAEQTAILTRELAHFCEEKLPKLLSLGLLAEARQAG